MGDDLFRDTALSANILSRRQTGRPICKHLSTKRRSLRAVFAYCPNILGTSDSCSYFIGALEDGSLQII